MLANGISVGIGTGARAPEDLDLVINSGTQYVHQGTPYTESSDFEVAEVIVWDRGLSSAEMHAASDSLMWNVLGISPSPSPPALTLPLTFPLTLTSLSSYPPPRPFIARAARWGWRSLGK